MLYRRVSVRPAALLALLIAFIAGTRWLPVAQAADPTLAPSVARLVFYEFLAGTPRNPVQSLSLRNAGTTPLTITALALADDPASPADHAAQFAFRPAPALPVTLAPNASLAVPIGFVPTSLGPKAAFLQVSFGGPAPLRLPLRGLAIQARGGSGEPSLQWVFDTLQLPLATGDPDPATNALGRSHLPWGDEVLAQRFVKAGPGPVSVEALAAFGPSTQPMARLSWYAATGSAPALQALFSVPQSQAQALLPTVDGPTSFDPGSQPFALAATWPQFASQSPTVGEDARNTWEANPRQRHKLRVYPLRQPDGTPVADAYVVVIEETTGQDYQDLVLLLRNLRPAPLALTLEFDQAVPGTLFDQDGQGLGFPTTQRNRVDRIDLGSSTIGSYDPTQLDLDPAAGLLRVRTTRTSSAQNGFENLRNGLVLPFDGSSGPFTVTARLRGPLSQLTANSQQAGIVVGPSEDSFIKLIAAQLGGVDVLELYHETNDQGTSRKVDLPSPATLATLELYLRGDPATGQVRAAYRAVTTGGGDSGVVPFRSGGTEVVIPLRGAARAAFFSGASAAGLTVSARDTATQVTFAFERFAISGAPAAPPSPTATSTATQTTTSTPTPTATSTPTQTATNGPSSTPTQTATNGSSSTPTQTATNGPSSTPTQTATDGPSSTPTQTATNGPSSTPTTSPTTNPTPGAAPRQRIYLPTLDK